MLDSAFGDFNEHTVEFLSFCFKGDLGADDARRFRSAENGEPHTADSLSGIWLKLPVKSNADIKRSRNTNLRKICR